MINTANPDIPLVHEKVAAAIAKAEGRTPETEKAETAEAAPEAEAPTSETPVAEETPTAPATPKAPPSVTGGSIGSLSEGYAANQSEDLGAVC
jgi:hypothetical protein